MISESKGRISFKFYRGVCFGIVLRYAKYYFTGSICLVFISRKTFKLQFFVKDESIQTSVEHSLTTSPGVSAVPQSWYTITANIPTYNLFSVSDVVQHCRCLASKFHDRSYRSDLCHVVQSLTITLFLIQLRELSLPVQGCRELVLPHQLPVVGHV